MIKVIYHANCSDGFCAAYLLWRKFGNDAEYIPFNYGIDLQYNNFNKDDELYIVDFSFKQPVLVELADIVKNITVLDHHKTAQIELDHGHWPENVKVYFDMGRSGAMMVWDYLYNTDIPLPMKRGELTPVPEYKNPSDLVKYVQDRDLWKFELPDSKEINAYIQAQPFDFSEWCDLEAAIKSNFNKIVDLGSAILLKLNQQIKQAVGHASMQTLSVPNGTEYTILAVNSTVNFSEVAGELAEQADFGVAWFRRSDGKYQYSLRSRDGLDVSKVAKAFGGGGHKNAAGFESDELLLKKCFNFNSLLGQTIKVSAILSQSGYITVFGHDPCGGNTLQPSIYVNKPHFIVYETDGEGNRLNSNNFTITEKEMEGILNEQ